ncbi:putative PEP-binding protein [Phytohabitans rumicis]|uniref:putative PEP-binding protein n=1 Tax=Phytohabitans rumicis TaxID=1076125 RepID=UPI001566C21D|nr:putative PEP-binding protein [Phytohabitans rumicis]
MRQDLARRCGRAWDGQRLASAAPKPSRWTRRRFGSLWTARSCPKGTSCPQTALPGRCSSGRCRCTRHPWCGTSRARSPFESIDVAGVGRLMRIAVDEGRAARPDLKIGVCGEHGGDPDSIGFFHAIGLAAADTPDSDSR